MAITASGRILTLELILGYKAAPMRNPLKASASTTPISQGPLWTLCRITTRSRVLAPPKRMFAWRSSIASRLIGGAGGLAAVRASAVVAASWWASGAAVGGLRAITEVKDGEKTDLAEV